MFIKKISFKRALFFDIGYEGFKKLFPYQIIIGLILVGIYLLAFFLLKHFLNFDQIAHKLINRNGITPINLIFVGLFIILINSYLEEYFWRGYLFKEFSSCISPFWAHLLSGFGFSLHHLVFIYDWFNIPFFIVTFIGLSGYGIIMNLIYQKTKGILSTWVIHILVDLVQVGLGFYIFLK
ncbi:CPBP family intramembrane metalloprotease [bacterium]|nr:CPBP family intramembrane metalloprotease [bacterium]